MSVTVANSGGVTVLTLTADPDSSCPPLCQLLKGLCCSPRSCTVSQQLKEKQGTSQSLLGTLHIMTGLLNIGLSVILFSGRGAAWTMRHSSFPYWIGGMFILMGAMCILSERRPSPSLVILNVTLNIAGFVFAVAAIGLYSENIAELYLWQICEFNYFKTPWEKLFEEKCGKKLFLTEVLVKGINCVLVILSVVEVCVCISSVVMGIKAFGNSPGTEKKSDEDPEQCTPLLAGGSGDPPP